MSELIQPELDYKVSANNHSTTVFRTLAPQGSSSIALSPSSSVGPVEFLISPSVWCPAKSRLNFQLQMITGGTTNVYPWTSAVALRAFSRVVLYDSATSNVILDVSNFESFASLVGVTCTELTTFLTKAEDALIGGASSSAGSTPYPFEDIHKTNALVNYTGITTGDVGSYNYYLGRKNYDIGVSTSTAAVAYYNYSIPFSAFKMTELSSSKLIYSPSNLVLQLYPNKTDNFFFNAASATDASTPASGLTGSIMANMSVSLANEGNLDLVSQIIGKVMSSGLSFPIAYPTTIRIPVAASTSASWQQQLTRGYGQRILFIQSAPFAADGTTLVYNPIHVRTDLTTYNVFLNGVAIKNPNGYDCTKGEDYMLENKEYLKGSVVQTLGSYVYNDWSSTQSWCGEKPLHTVDQHEIDGLPVGAQSSTWSILANRTGATASTWIMCIIGQKIMSIGSGGVIVS